MDLCYAEMMSGLLHHAGLDASHMHLQQGARSRARRDQEELADYSDDEITPKLTEVLASGLREQYAREQKDNVCWVSCNLPHSGPRARLGLAPCLAWQRQGRESGSQ